MDCSCGKISGRYPLVLTTVTFYTADMHKIREAGIALSPPLTNGQQRVEKSLLLLVNGVQVQTNPRQMQSMKHLDCQL